MQEEFPEAEIFEIKKIGLKNPIVFAGFVGAGLVGPLAINHIITELKMTEIAVMRSKYLPPSTVFMSCLLYTSPSPRDRQKSRMPSSA